MPNYPFHQINPLAQQHPLANVHDYSSIDQLSFEMPNKGNYSLGTIPLQVVAPLTDTGVEKLSLNREAAPEMSTTGGSNNGHSSTLHSLYANSNTMPATTSLVNANGGGTSSHISSQQQKYLASLLNIEEVNPVSGKTSLPGSKPAELPTSSRDAGVGGGNPLSYQPYPNPKSSTAPAAALPLLASGGRGNPKANAGHCNHRNGHSHRCYASSGSFDGATTALTTTDDETCSISTSASKHEESFSLKFPKLRYVKVALLAGLIIYTLVCC